MQSTTPPLPPMARAFHQLVATIPDPRSPRGRRYPLRATLTAATAAMQKRGIEPQIVALKAAPVAPRQVVDLRIAAELLADAGGQIDHATDQEKRRLLQLIFSAFYISAKPHRVESYTPTTAYLPLIGVMREAYIVMSPQYGVADGARTRNILFHREALHH